MANEIALKQALEDEAFVKELMEMEEPQQVCDALNAKGAEVTLEEVQRMAQSLSAQTDGELDEDELEDVAGGVNIHITVTDPQLIEYVKEQQRTNPRYW